MTLQSNPLVGSASRSEEELDVLRALAGRFVALEGETAGRQQLYHRVLAVVHQLCAAIVACEEAGYVRDEIIDVLEPVRRIHARSPFVKRLQEWPRAYPGDFETVEHLCSATNRAEEGTLPWFCESYALSRSIAQLGPIFDLVLAGGLFDYLPEKHAIYLIEHSYSLLKRGGTFFFTNIAEGNPYRPLIEYFGDWFLIERSEAGIRSYCEAAGIPAHEIAITREETGLTLLIEVTRS